MSDLTVNVEPLYFSRVDVPWLSDMQPYPYQQRVYALVERALTEGETLCLFLVTPTGSGKTLGSYAYAINHRIPALGVYPTNALIRDQERALKSWLDPEDYQRLLRIDSKQLDYWQTALNLPQHALTFETLMNWSPTILTNPDILFYTFFGLYQGQAGISQRLFALMGQYRYFVFDEFHLYNVKQMADVAFFVSTLHAINPTKGRVFIFASATPDSPARHWLEERLHLPVEVIEGKPSDASDAKCIAQPLELVLLPADLRRWRGVETLLDYLPTLQAFIQVYPQARLVTILDSVVGAIEAAQALQDLFPGKAVGEVHGVTSDTEREIALRCPITVGTSTIEVGIDFKDEAEKDVLIFEARTASQFVQRFGRLARHKKALPIPNRIVALVPEYVYHFLEERLSEVTEVSRHEVYDLMREAYQRPEDFSRYLHKHAPAELHEARWQAQGLFQSDDRPRIVEALEDAIEALTCRTGNQAKGQYWHYKEEHILQPLLTFRGSEFEVAFLDQREGVQGFPVKRYSLMFLLRRGMVTEIDQETYLEHLDRLEDTWSAEVARERRYSACIKRKPEALLGVYGYFQLNGIREEARKVFFEIDEEALYGHKAQVTVISGLKLITDPPLRLPRLTRFLRRKRIVAWFTDRHPASVKLGRALPPLFEIYQLRVRGLGGTVRETPWSITFNQNAFFVDSLNWYMDQREDKAVIL
jgi:CRISPR-associated endonuclease/helicase Cas3